MIRLLRTLLCCISFGIFGIGGLIVGLIIFPTILLLFRGERQRRILSATIHHTWGFFIRLLSIQRLISVQSPDYAKFHQLRGQIVIANHPSLLDVVIMVSMIPKSICVVKENLFHNFFIGRIVRRIYLSNSMSPDEFLSRGTQYLDEGYNIIIFPEGTRTIPGRAVHFHRGFAYLQIASRHAITPVHIANHPRILGKDQPWYDIGACTSVYTLRILPPIMAPVGDTQPSRHMAITISRMAHDTLFPASHT